MRTPRPRVSGHRGAVRASRIVAVGGVAVALAIVSVAFAQPRRRPPVHPKPAASADAGATDNPYADDSTKGASDAAPAPTASVAAVPSTGPVPPPPATQLYDGGMKPSPLNPAANEFSDGGAPPQTLDYDRLLADIAALRARVAAVSDNLFRSRVAVAVETSGDHGRIAHLEVSLDDGVVYTAPANFHADDSTVVYDHSAAPGRHAVTIEVERRDDRDDSFRTTQRSRFVVDIPRDNRMLLDVRIWDDSNMGKNFEADHSGRYELKIRAKASAAPVSK
jgi:hypothetical protein